MWPLSCCLVGSPFWGTVKLRLAARQLAKCTFLGRPTLSQQSKSCLQIVRVGDMHVLWGSTDLGVGDSHWEQNFSPLSEYLVDLQIRVNSWMFWNVVDSIRFVNIFRISRFYLVRCVIVFVLHRFSNWSIRFDSLCAVCFDFRVFRFGSYPYYYY